MASPLNNGLMTFYDNKGNTLSNGKVFAFALGTDNPITTYLDSGEVITNGSPIILNSSGQAYIYANQDATLRMYDKCGALIGQIDAYISAGGGVPQIILCPIAIPDLTALSPDVSYEFLSSDAGNIMPVTSGTLDGCDTVIIEVFSEIGIGAWGNGHIYVTSNNSPLAVRTQILIGGSPEIINGSITTSGDIQLDWSDYDNINNPDRRTFVAISPEFSGQTGVNYSVSAVYTWI